MVAATPSSRARASAGDSPASTLPPGNSHFNPCESSRFRWQTSSFESRVMRAATTVGTRGGPQENGDELNQKRVRLFGVDSQILDGFFHDRRVNLSVLKQLIERGQRDEARVHFKEVTQRLAAVAASEAVGSQRGQPARQPLADQIGQSFQVIRGGDQNSRRIAEALRNIWDARFFRGMQEMPALSVNAGYV